MISTLLLRNNSNDIFQLAIPEQYTSALWHERRGGGGGVGGKREEGGGAIEGNIALRTLSPKVWFVHSMR